MRISKIKFIIGTWFTFTFLCVSFVPEVHAETFHIVSLKLLAPHFYYEPTFLECSDVTNEAPLKTESVNEKLQASLFRDREGNFLTDFGVIIDIDNTAKAFAISQTECRTDALSECNEKFKSTFTFSFSKFESGKCIDVSEFSFADINPNPQDVNAPCLKSEEGELEFEFSGTGIKFKNTTLVIQKNGKQIKGVILAFLTEEEAFNTEVEGKKLSTFLRGSKSCCEPGDDREVNAEGKKGWWFYIEFDAVKATLFNDEGCGCTSSGVSSMSWWILTAVFLVFQRKFRPVYTTLK